jgi:hypothetical protein
LTQLVKYLPLEVLGACLFVAGIIKSNVGRYDLAAWLGYSLIGFGVITALYDWRVLKISRWQQILVSVVGLGVYVFALGDWFATMTWYHPWYAAILLPLFALLVAIIQLPPLPTDSSTVDTGVANEAKRSSLVVAGPALS